MVDGSVFLRRELMIRFVRAFNNGSLETELDRFPVLMRPRQGGSSRCCVYRDRAVIKYRLMNLLPAVGRDISVLTITAKVSGLALLPCVF